MASMTFTPLAARTTTTQRVAARKAQAVVVRAQADAQACSPIFAPKKALKRFEVPAAVRTTATTLVANAAMAVPAHAEAGALFDFNLTLPIMTTEFLALMVLLDNFWFRPVGAVLSERDEQIRSKLGGVSDNTADIARMEDEAAAVISAARKEAADEIQSAKTKAEEEYNAKVAAAKAQVDKELAQAMASLDQQKKDAMATLDAQVEKLSDEIVEKVLVGA